jgi:hypothetical protein
MTTAATLSTAVEILGLAAHVLTGAPALIAILQQAHGALAAASAEGRPLSDAEWQAVATTRDYLREQLEQASRSAT